jgi:NAD(P)-dependent dehydrogenase (short-subunit alcohol dehydrogenase family)
MSWDLSAGLADRGAIVTGAGGTIGAEVVRALAAAGARVAAVDLAEEPLRRVIDSLEHPERHLCLPADLRDLDAIEQLVEQAAEALGRIDVLVHAAATLRRIDDLEQVTVDDWQAQEEVNLRATFFLGRAAARRMRAHGEGGRIVNFASQGWWTGGFGGSTVYAATKGGVVSLSRGLARELGADGVTVNTVSPGAVESRMMNEDLSPEARAAFLAQIPLGRFARPAEVAGAVVFLCSAHAGYITGATLNVSGGQLMY